MAVPKIQKVMNEIYWLLHNTSDLPDDDDWLSEKESSLLRKMKFRKRRGEWRSGRWTAKCLIASYLKMKNGIQFPFSEIEIFAAGSGAPKAFFQSKPLPLGISISHRSEKGFCVLQPQDRLIGCDLEIIEPRSDAFIKDYFTSEEYSRVSENAAKDRSLIANLIWSAKESVLKALEKGLKCDTRSVLINPDDLVIKEGWNEIRARSLEFNRDFYGWWRVEGAYLMTILTDERSAMVDEIGTK